MSIDNGYLLSLFGGSSGSSADGLLQSLMTQPALSPQGQANFNAATGAAAGAGSANPATSHVQPTPPWRPHSGAASSDALAKSVLAGRAFINEGAVKIDVPGASTDYTKLFALYQGLSALDGLAAQASDKSTTSLQQLQLQRAFAAGVAQVGSYVDGMKLDKLEIAAGKATSSEQTTVGARTDNSVYTGAPLFQGAQGDVVPAFQGDVQFSMQIAQLHGGTGSVDFNLAEMDQTPRTMQNVLDYLNGKLADAGYKTRFGKVDIPAPPHTITVGGKVVTLPAAPDQYALSIKGSTLETVSLSAPQTADAVYVTQSATTTATSATPAPTDGSPRPSGTTTTMVGDVTTTVSGSTTTTVTTAQQLLKFQSGQDATADPPPDAQPRPGDPLSVAGRAWSATLADTVTAARATATGPDGSVYVLADVDGTTASQGLKGASDVALFKYDPAGKLLFSRTLGAASQASGFALAVSADGKVAVAGSVTGELNQGGKVADDSGVDPTASDSFVSVFNAAGEEQWTQRRGGRAADQANAVTFGADGSVYVAGKASSAMPGSGVALGGSDGYVEGFTAAGKVSFTSQFGTSSSDSASAIAVDGSAVIVGGIENGHAVVRRFDTTSGSAGTLLATRDLGDLQGGSLAGIAVDGGKLIVAGTARNTGLGGAAATNASAGGSDVFTAAYDPGLTDTSSDHFTWFGGTGDDTATAMAVHNGQVYITGKTGSDLPGTTKIGSQDGFLTQIDATTGAVASTERFNGPGGKVAPSSIAVAAGGASVLDRLGLPTGKVTTSDSPLLTAATALRAGDQFFVKSDSTGSVKVTIEAADTMYTLATKIQRASGFRATVSVLSSNGMQTLMIKPASSLSQVVLAQGPVGQDALGPLGLVPGLIRPTPTSSSKSSSSTTKLSSGLGLSNNLNLLTPDAIVNAKTVMDQALSTVRVAYNNILTGGKVAPTRTPGTVPQYLANQITNYQAALARLGG